MAQRVFDGDAGALRKADDEKLMRAQAAAFAGIQNQAMAPFHRTSQERLVRFQRFHEPAGIPQAIVGIGRDPAGAADLEAGGQVQHLLFGAGAAVEQDPGPLRRTPRLARFAEADSGSADA